MLINQGAGNVGWDAATPGAAGTTTAASPSVTATVGQIIVPGAMERIPVSRALARLISLVSGSGGAGIAVACKIYG